MCAAGILERQLSSIGCSTSYATGRYSARDLRIWKRRPLHARCNVQPSRQYPGTSCQDPVRRHVSPHRPTGSVAASAAAVAPASPPQGGLHSLSADPITSIPDATPSLEELEDLHSRAVRVSHARTTRPPTPPHGARNGSRHQSEVNGDAATPTSTLAANGHASVAPREELSGANGYPGYAGHQPHATHQAGPAPKPLHGTNTHRGPSSGPHALNGTRAASAQPRPNLPPTGGSGRHSSFARRRPSAGQSVMQLTMAIKQVQDWRQLPRLLEELAPSGLDPFNAAAFLTHLAQRAAAAPPVSPAEVQAVERMQAAALQVVEQNMHEYRARQLSNITWALARLGLPAGAAFIRDHLTAASYPLLPWYEPQHLANTAWALSATGVSPNDGWLEEFLTVAFEVLRRRAFAPQHLANVLWALERLGVMPEQDWMAAFYDCVAAALPATNAQDCSNILSSLALMAMHEQSPDATSALASRLSARFQSLLTAAAERGRAAATATAPTEALSSSVLTPTPVRNGSAAVMPAAAGPAAAAAASGEADVSDQSIANSVWALTVMGYGQSDELWAATAEALRSRLANPKRPAPGVHPAALSIVLWAAATARRPLPAPLMGLLYGRVRGPALQATDMRSLSTMVWAVATAPAGQARPPADWVADAIMASGRSVSQLGPQALSNLLYAVCQLGARPPPVWMSAVINHFHRNLGAEASAQSVSNVLWCLTKMGYRLNAEGLDILLGMVRSRLEAWQEQLLRHAQQGQQKSGQQQGHGHERQPQQAPSAQSVPPPFNAQEVSNLLYALANMGYAPEPEGPTAQLLLAAARERLREANAQELGNTMWSLAAMQVRPPDAWLRDYYAAATACLPSFQPVDLAQSLYGAAKLQLPLCPAASVAALAASPAPAGSAINARSKATGTGPAPADGASNGNATADAASAWLSAAMAAAPRLVSCGSAQDLCDLSWALVQLRVPVRPDGPLAGAFATRLVSLAAACEPAQLALGVWALGKWRVRPSKVQLQQLEVATFRKVQAMRPHELAAMLSGFAGMNHTPPTEWLEDAVQQIATRSREFGPQDWTVVVSSLARVQDDSITPHTEELVARLLPRMHRLPLPSLVLLAYSCGCMGPSQTSRALVSRCLTLLAEGGAAADAARPDGVGGAGDAAVPLKPARRRCGKAGKVAEAGSAAGRAVEAAGQAAGPQAAREAQEEGRPVAVEALTASELSALLWAAVRVGFRSLPQEFRAQFLSCTAPLLPDLPASLVASYLWAAGRLRMWLPPLWRSELVRRAEAVLPAMRPQELVMCLSGLMWLRVWPSDTLLRGLQAAFKTHGSQVDERLRPHAENALRVLAKRLATDRHRRALYGRRFVWRSRVRSGVERAAAAAAEGKGKGHRSSWPKPKGYLTRRGALRAGVVRGRPSRSKAAKQAPAAEAQ